MRAETVEALLALADDMETAMSGGPEFIGPTGRMCNASEQIRRILERAAPDEMASAWDEGKKYGFDLARSVIDPVPNPNPYK